MRYLGLIAVIVVAASVGWLSGGNNSCCLRAADGAAPATQPATSQTAALPTLMDFGAKTCIPCKRMAPILEELSKELAGKLVVTFVDVSVAGNMPQARSHGIKLIPTQIFVDAAGKELWRHEGFLSKEDLLAKWKELGYEFSGK
ncbi:MAG: thioredoxin family protein [Planctomycetaceae bacterium]|nr:thioredoxin family protein [Planctomycetaceae bacterium]